MAELTVLDQKISYFKIEDEDYISITDMLKSKMVISSYLIG